MDFIKKFFGKEDENSAATVDFELPFAYRVVEGKVCLDVFESLK
jgi:hypothetical protein